VRHYYTRCIADYCAAAAAAERGGDVSVAMETDAAVCQTLDAYSELCVARNSAFSWRTASLCRTCPAPARYAFADSRVTTNLPRNLPVKKKLKSAKIRQCLRCFDAVGWAAGRAPGLQKTEW